MSLIDRIRNSKLSAVAEESEIRTPLSADAGGDQGIKVLTFGSYFLIGDAKAADEDETVEAEA